MLSWSCGLTWAVLALLLPYLHAACHSSESQTAVLHKVPIVSQSCRNKGRCSHGRNTAVQRLPRAASNEVNVRESVCAGSLRASTRLAQPFGRLRHSRQPGYASVDHHCMQAASHRGGRLRGKADCPSKWHGQRCNRPITHLSKAGESSPQGRPAASVPPLLRP